MSLRLYIRDVGGVGYNELFIDNGNALPVNLAIKDFNQISGAKNNVSYFTYSVSIPYDLNAAALASAVDLNVTSAQDLPGVELNAFLESSFYTFRGVLKISSYEKQGNVTSVKAQFLGGLKNWINLLPEYLRELELGESLFDTASVSSIYSDSNPYDGSLEVWYSLKYYQKFIDPDFVSTLDFRQDVYFAAIIRAIEVLSSTPIQSNLFASEYFRRMLMPYVGDGRVIYRQWDGFLNTDRVISVGEFVNAFTSIWTTDDPLGALTAFTPVGAIPIVDDEVNMTFKCVFNVTTAKTSLFVILSDQNLNTKDSISIPAGITSFELSGVFESGNRPQLFIEGDCVLLTGSSIELQVEGSQFEGVYIKHRSAIRSDLKTADWISGLSDLFNLVWFYDENNEVLICDPKWNVLLPTGETVRGFYSDLAEDYSGIQDCDTESGDFGIDVDVKRSLIMAFQHDKDDRAVKSDRKWSHLEVLPPKFADGETLQRNEAFAPTVNQALPDAYTGGTNPAIVPTFLKDSADEIENADYDFISRVLYKIGVLPYSWKFNNASVVSGAPIAAQVLEVAVALPPGLPGFANVGMGDFNKRLGLSNLFYWRDFEIYRNGVIKTVNMALPVTALLNLEVFFRLLKFTNTQESGALFHVLDSAQIIVNMERISEVKLIALP